MSSQDEESSWRCWRVPSSVAQALPTTSSRLGVRVIFNYSEALLQTPPEVTVHASSPAVDLLHALYFYLA